VHDVVDVVQRTHQPALIPHVTDEPPQPPVVGEQLAELVLLELVP
jgi:hypothetical protein